MNNDLFKLFLSGYIPTKSLNKSIPTVIEQLLFDYAQILLETNILQHQKDFSNFFNSIFNECKENNIIEDVMKPLKYELMYKSTLQRLLQPEKRS